MFCPKCGSKNEESAAFCSSCGEKLNAPQAAEAAKGVPVVTTTAAGSVTTGDGSTAKAAKKTGTVIGIIVVVVIVAAIVVAAITTGGFGLMGSGVSVKGSVNDYSWEELSAISNEISKASDENGAIETAKKYNLCTSDGKLDGTQTKSITLSDGTDVEVQITGFSHDDKTSGGKAGITFIFKDAIVRHDMNSTSTNAGGWEGSQMRSWLASDGIDMLPDDLADALVEVNKRTNNVGKTESASAVSMTGDKLWLYSFVELAGSVSESYFRPAFAYMATVFNAEGSQYKLYRDMGVNSEDANGILVKWYDGESCFWWERSPFPFYSDFFCGIDYYGNPRGEGDVAVNPDGVVPGFCI